jgi:hypothetical protein
MDEVDCTSPADGSISVVGGGTDVYVEAGDPAPTGGGTILSYLQEHGISLCTLVAMTMSHRCKKLNGTVMLEITAEPFVSMPAKTVKALASDYHNEVTRGYLYSHEEHDPLPCPKQWSILKCQEWLNCHPIDDGGELNNIKAEIEKYRVVTEKAASEREENDKALNGGKKWQGKYPMLCMMHALVDHDEIKRAYLTHHDLPAGRIGIENCHTAATMAQNV